VLIAFPISSSKDARSSSPSSRATELFQLTADVRRQFIEEMTYVAAVLDRVFTPDKINYTLLGNVVPHLH
jgi:diadenosine tetraphosphate (Ap4A) HIT family hydrolase